MKRSSFVFVVSVERETKANSKAKYILGQTKEKEQCHKEEWQAYTVRRGPKQGSRGTGNTCTTPATCIGILQSLGGFSLRDLWYSSTRPGGNRGGKLSKPITPPSANGGGWGSTLQRLRRLSPYQHISSCIGNAAAVGPSAAFQNVPCSKGCSSSALMGRK